MGTVPALTDETPLDQYTATASQTEFTFTFMIFATSDIKVYVNDVLKTETTDYVVKQADLSAIVPADDLPMDGGKVVFNSGLTVSDAVSISRKIPIDRLTGYSVAGAFRANVLNTELTRMQAINQQLERDISRSIRLSPSDAEGGNLDMPTGRAGKFLAFDESGNLIMSAGSADSITVSTFMATVLDDTTAAAARTTMGLAIGSDVQAYDAELAALAGLTSAANKVPYFTGSETAGVLDFKDEDNMASDSATAVASQQSIKAYVDSNVSSDASTTVKGIVELLTDAELVTGTDNTRAATAANILSLFASSSQSTNGYARIPLNISGAFDEIIIQWGTYTGGASNPTVNLNLTFPNTNLAVFTTGVQVNFNTNAQITNVLSKTASNFTAATVNSTNASAQVWDFYWLAIGY